MQSVQQLHRPLASPFRSAFHLLLICLTITRTGSSPVSSSKKQGFHHFTKGDAVQGMASGSFIHHQNLTIMRKSKESSDKSGSKTSPRHDALKTQSTSTGSTKKPDTQTRNQLPAISQNLGELFQRQLQDAYWSEHAVRQALPYMIRNVKSKDLEKALNGYLDVTEQHVSRVEKALATLKLKPSPSNSQVMESLLRDVRDIIDSTAPGSVRDAGIICAAQKVDHYEIAAYGTLSAYARQLGLKDAAALLEQNLQEEKEADSIFTGVAVDAINKAASVA